MDGPRFIITVERPRGHSPPWGAVMVDIGSLAEGGDDYVKISEVPHGIRKLDAVLPEFQREHVWSRDLARQLLVYPIRG